MQLVMAILAVVIGLAFAFGGWRFFLVLLPLWGFVVGFSLGTEGMRALFGDGTFATVTSWVVGLVVALVFAALSYLYYYAAIAILAGAVGYTIGASAWGIIGNEQGVIAFVIGLVVGVVVAVAVLALNVPRLARDRADRSRWRGDGRRGLVPAHRQGPGRQRDLVAGRSADQGQLVLPHRLGAHRGGRHPRAAAGAGRWARTRTSSTRPRTATEIDRVAPRSPSRRDPASALASGRHPELTVPTARQARTIGSPAEDKARGQGCCGGTDVPHRRTAGRCAKVGQWPTRGATRL